MYKFIYLFIYLFIFAVCVETSAIVSKGITLSFERECDSVHVIIQCLFYFDDHDNEQKSCRYCTVTVQEYC